MEVGGGEWVGYQKAPAAEVRVAPALVAGSEQVPPSHQPPPSAPVQSSRTLVPMLSPSPTTSFLHTHLVFPLHRSHTSPVPVVVMLEVCLEARCKSEYLEGWMTCREVAGTCTYAVSVEHPRGTCPCHLTCQRLGTQIRQLGTWIRAASPEAAGASGSVEAAGSRGCCWSLHLERHLS